MQQQFPVRTPKINISEINIDMELIKKCGFKLPDYCDFNNSSAGFDLSSVEVKNDVSADFILDQANALLGHAEAFDQKADEYEHYNHMFSVDQEKVGKG